ncbi:MAG: hypothetical protein NZO58_08110, partial [Gemmataceae bacterium]|nr:hypothetical protein [Gemmataceae bacterium]
MGCDMTGGVVRFGLTIVLGGFAATAAHANAELPKELAQLNTLTGSGPLGGAIKQLLAEPKKAKKLLEAALPLTADAAKQVLSYNAALVLASVAAEFKDFKAAETLYRVCINYAVKLQSADKLLQSYGALIDLYFENKRYDDSARICRELLELKTDDGKERYVLVPFENRFGEITFEEFERFDSADRLRPGVHRLLIQSIAKKGDYKQALRLADNLLKARDHWFQRQLKGWVLREAGEYEEAAKVYEEVVAQVRDDKEMDPAERSRYLDAYQYTLS